MTIGQRLRDRRLELGRTLAEVSGPAEISVGYLSELERGLAMPPLDTLSRIAGSLETSPILLLVGVDGFGTIEAESGFSVDGSTTIGPAGSQTIRQLAERLCSLLTPLDKEWTDSDRHRVTSVLFSVYLAGYQRGCLSTTQFIARKKQGEGS